jgi:hypothetical protein
VSERLYLPTFVMGPEPDGRGSGILSQSGLPAGAGWQGSLPLVLLEWAKLRATEGFCGRFAVTGGAIALRAAYFGEGAAGPIARAFGVFIDEESLPQVLNSERSLFAAMPVPTSDNDFGLQPLAVDLTPDAAAPDWERLSLGWQDRQIFADVPQSLESCALKALASIQPLAQKARITGWCTTGQLAARGDFLPIQRCNLLVTRSTESLAHDRFLPAGVVGDAIDGATAAPPENYDFWQQLTQLLGPQPGRLRDAMAWYAEMSEWTDEELGWRFIEILSQHQAEYPVIVGAILSMNDFDGGRRQAVSAAITGNYLVAVAGYDRTKLPELIAMFWQYGGAKRPAVAKALDESILALFDAPLLDQIDDDSLLRITRLLAEQVLAGPVDYAHSKLELLDDQSVWRALGRNIRSPGSSEGERRVHLSAIRQHLGRGPDAGALDYRKLFLRRKIVGHMLNDRGA